MSEREGGPAGEILKTLSKVLPDESLELWFPSLPPFVVRGVLLRAAEEMDFPVAVEPVTENDATKDDSREIPHRLSLFTDGASKGNPGEAGAGVVVFDENQQIVREACKYLGYCTNNVAEYKALILGLEEVERLGAREVSIFVDSELLARQVQGRYAVRNANLRPLFGEIQKRLSVFRKYTISHVRREENVRADQLANEAIKNSRKA